MKIYCAGPLFNKKEKEEMEEIAKVLEEGDYTVFLPHRDGIEAAKEPLKDLSEIMQNIFLIDIAQVMNSDGLVFNMNGRVPDEGAIVEAAVAWALSKPVVIYKSDNRSLMKGQDNPMILGLSDFSIVCCIPAIPAEFDILFKERGYSNPGEVYKKGLNIYEEICSK